MEKHMQMSVRGKNEKLTKKETKSLLSFLGQELLGPKLAPNVYVELHFQPLEGNVWGLCSPTDYDYKTHRDFDIWISPEISKKEQLKTICHEMVHVKQYARGELKDYSYCKFKWKGVKLLITEDEDYYTAPWETEANELESVLYNKYKKHLKG